MNPALPVTRTVGMTSEIPDGAEWTSASTQAVPYQDHAMKSTETPARHCPRLRRIDTVSSPLLATARSGKESPLKSPTATAWGALPTGYVSELTSVPLLLPRKIVM